MCTADASGGFTCPHGRVTYSSSLIWGRHLFLLCPSIKPYMPNDECTTGALGPARNFSPGQIYGKLLWFFLAGPLVIVLTYLLGRRWKVFNNISWPVAFGAMSLVPPATGVNFSSWWVVNVLFSGIIRRRRAAWWSKYNYVLSAALDSGVAVATVIIFFCIILPGGTLHWWGNTVYKNTADGKGTPWKKLPVEGYFGPVRGSWE